MEVRGVTPTHSVVPISIFFFLLVRFGAGTIKLV